MNLIGKVFMLLMLSLCYALSDAASVNVTISSQNIQNGSLLTLTATCDPIVGASTFVDLRCKYSDLAGGAATDLTKYKFRQNKIIEDPGLSAYNRARVNITSPLNPMVLVISPITFDDEKRLFYCVLSYDDAGGIEQPPITSEQHRLENVYSAVTLNPTDSISASTSVTEGIPANLTCIATGRPAPIITWLYDSAIIATSSSTNSSTSPLITVTGTLSIYNPTQTMDGQLITCLASHRFTSSLNKTTMLDVYYRPVNTSLVVSPQNPLLNEEITLSCSAVGKPNLITYRFFISQTYIGNSTSGNFSVNANNCSRYNGNYRCVPVNAQGEGKEKQELVVVKDDVTTSVVSGSQTFNETSTGTLLCNVTGCPIPSVTWSKNGMLLNESGNSLTLPSLSKADAGRYSCRASNDYTNSSSDIEVIVNYQPVGTQLSLNNTKPLVNATVMFNCTSDAVPPAKYRFLRMDASGQSVVSSSNSETNGILVVASIMHTLSVYNVTYKCIPYNLLGNGPEKTMMVDIQVPAKIDQFSIIPRMVNETGNVSIECKASGNPAPNITLLGPSNLAMPHTMGKAEIKNINRNQSGFYTCRVNNGLASPVSARIELVVTYVPEMSSLRAMPSRVYTGSNLTITCSAIGSPTPRYRFYHKNGTIVQDSFAASYSTVLRYEDYPDYSATFKCVPYNVIGEGAAQNVTVEILVPPRLSVSMSPHTVNESQNATFSCVIDAANPPANITLRGPLDQTIEDIQGIAILSNVTRNDAGTYSCVAENGLTGSPVQKTAVLSVNHAPDQVQLNASSLTPISGSSVTFTCTARGWPSPSYRFTLVNGSSTVTVQDGSSSHYTTSPLGYMDYVNYTVTYQCISYNSLGESPPQTQVLDIQVHPVLSFSITPSLVNETQNATVDCIVIAANPAVSVTIRGNNNQLIPHVGGRAIIEHIKRAQSGVYTCIADNGVGGIANLTATLNVDNYAPDSVELSASSLTPMNGSSVTLNCSAPAKPPPSRYVFSTIRGSAQTIAQDGMSSTYLIGIINFKNFINYKAMFACVPHNIIGRGPSKNITLDIQVPPQISTSSAIAAVEGHRVVLHCNVTAANPAANVTWHSPTGTELQNMNGRILLPSVNRNHNGLYTCRASNGVGSVAIKTTYLSVNYGPETMHSNVTVSKCVGESAVINCSATGQPLPDIFLYHNGVFVTRNSSSLSYHIQVDASKFGTYMCISNNTLGTVSVTTTVNAKAPGSVQKYTLSPKDDTIKVTWTFSQNQCISNIRAIKVEYKKKSDNTWVTAFTVTNSDKEVIIKGLEKGVQYEVRVVVVDVNGKEYGGNANPQIANTERPADDDKGLLIGGIVGGIFLLILILVLCIFFVKKRRNSSAAEESIGSTNKGYASEKGQSANVEMGDLSSEKGQSRGTTPHYIAPDGSVYASVKGKSEDANGAIDNKNFVADSDGAYEPVNDEAKKKKEEGNYAELGAFVTPNNNDKPKEKPKTEYATLEELGPLKDYDETEKQKEEEPATHKITVEPESNEAIAYAPAAEPPSSAPAADPPSSAPAADSSGNGGISVNVDMI